MRLINFLKPSRFMSDLCDTATKSSSHLNQKLLSYSLKSDLFRAFICVLFLGSICGVNAQELGLPPDHFMARTLADSAQVYQHRLAARKFEAERDWGLAVGQWDRLLSYWPDDLEALTNKARILSTELLRPDDAVAVYELAAKHAPLNVDAHYGVCEIKSRIAPFSEAIRACEIVLELKRNHTGALRRIAGLLVKSGKPELAEGAYTHLIELLDTKEQLNDVLADLDEYKQSSQSSSDWARSLVPVLVSAWESDSLALRRRDRKTLELIAEQRMWPAAEKALSGGHALN
jgi:tetratricopeptide (TPR) repeat protein